MTIYSRTGAPHKGDRGETGLPGGIRIAKDAAALFYERLFEIDPSARHLFFGDMEEQGRKLMTMIAMAVRGLDAPILSQKDCARTWSQDADGDVVWMERVDETEDPKGPVYAEPVLEMTTDELGGDPTAANTETPDPVGEQIRAKDLGCSRSVNVFIIVEGSYEGLIS